MHSDHEDRVVLRAARDAAGGAQPLAHRAQEMCDSNPIPAGRPTMNTNLATLIACESVLDPILERLAMVLDEHSPNFAGPVAEALERLQSTAADTSLTISGAILETLGPIPPRRRWALVERADRVDIGR